MAKQLKCQKFVYKIHSSRLRKAKWDLKLPLQEARNNDEVIALADSLVLTWLDELNGIRDAEERARGIKAEIRRIKREPSSAPNKRRIRQLYNQLDSIQFKPDYLCVIMDTDADYWRACQGFQVNGITFHRLLGTNGGKKMRTIVFISDDHGDIIRYRIENERNASIPLVTAKLESYKALACSASTPVSWPNGILVVPDCETQFYADTVYIDDAGDGEPTEEAKPNTLITLDESDGYGLMLPSLAERWSAELGLSYMASGMNTRLCWEKGMVFAFDFLQFADEIAGGRYIVKDAWGDEVDIRNVELILTTSMLKLWDSYESCADYIEKCKRNHYTFRITKTTPRELEKLRTTNYQFVQPFDLTDDDIEELISPTMERIRAALCNEWEKTVLFARGTGLTEQNADKGDDDWVKALMIEPEMMNDPYVQTCIYKMMKGRINRAKIGVLDVHGNYSIIGGDPYALCQSIFGLEVTGLLKAGEIYNQFWADTEAELLACFRAPMSCKENIRRVVPNRSDECRKWFKHISAATLLNAWDTVTNALNGADKDGDLIMLTDNPVLVGRAEDLPALMCVQRKAEKTIATEHEIIQTDINSFGEEIGITTNKTTSQYAVQADFEPGSREYEELAYRIRCGEL